MVDTPGRPEDGHVFRFTVMVRGSGGIMAEGDTEPHDYADSDWWGEVWTMDVRAWSLAAALDAAQQRGLGEWTRPNGKKLSEPS